MKRTNTLLLIMAIAIFTVSAKTTINLSVKGMHCGGCETKFKSAATSIDGITEVKSVSATNSVATLVYDEKAISVEKVIQSLADQTGFTISASTGTTISTVEGKPTGCCMKGQSNTSCKQGDQQKKCDKPTGNK